MKKSFSYRVVAAVLKLKGVKKVFSTDPIDYKKLRKEDVKNPTGSFYKKNATSFTILKSKITAIETQEKTGVLLLFIHGGAFVSGPVKHHWDTLKRIQKETKHTVWLCDYPKAPEHKITEISENIDAVYKQALTKFKAENIMLMGDSVGGTLCLALVQRLVKANKSLPLKMVLITPVLNATMNNVAINVLDKLDIILGKKGVLSAKKMCAENNDLTTPNISPIYGSFVNLPETIACLATDDIMYYDAKEMLAKFKENNIKYKVIKGEGMPHIWPLLPFLYEGKLAMKTIIKELKV